MPDYLHATAALTLAYWAIFGLLAVVVFLDASTRGDRALPAALATLVVGWPALAVYLAARRRSAQPQPAFLPVRPDA